MHNGVGISSLNLEVPSVSWYIKKQLFPECEQEETVSLAQSEFTEVATWWHLSNTCSFWHWLNKFIYVSVSVSLFLFNKNNSNNTLDNLWKDLHFCFRSSSCMVSISSRPHPAVWQQSVITHKIQIPIWLHPADPRHTLWPQTAGEYRRVGGCQQSRGRQQSASLSVHASIGIRRTLRARKLLSDNFTHSRFTWNYVKMHTCCCSGNIWCSSVPVVGDISDMFSWTVKGWIISD